MVMFAVKDPGGLPLRDCNILHGAKRSPERWWHPYFCSWPARKHVGGIFILLTAPLVTGACFKWVKKE